MFTSLILDWQAEIYMIYGILKASAQSIFLQLVS